MPARVPPLLDLIRLFVGVSLLGFASYTDWMWRRAPNLLWRVMSLAGLLLLGVEAWLDPAPWAQKWPYLAGLAPFILLWTSSTAGDLAAGILGVGLAAAILWVGLGDAPITDRWPFLVGIPVFAALIYLAHTLPPYLIAGGADAQALIALPLLLPFPIAMAPIVSPLTGLFPGAVAVLGNTLLVALVYPITMLVLNTARRDFGPHMFHAMRRPAKLARQGQFWPIEFVDTEGNRKTRFFVAHLPANEVDEAFERIRALGDERIWMTPKMPFLIPIAVGFALAFIAGDLLNAIVAAVAR